MAFNGSGVFLRLYNWVNDAAASVKIRADRMDAEFNGMATGLSTCITKDGQTTVTANLPMAGYVHTGVGNATATTNYATAGQVRDGSLVKLGSVSGTNTITATAAITITAYTAGQEFTFIAANTNTGATTINIDGVGAVDITKNGATALVAGDITVNAVIKIRNDGTRFQLLSSVPFSITALTADATPNVLDYVPTYDTSATTNKKVLLSDFYKTIDGMTADTTPDGTADFLVTYDTSATAGKKLLINNIYKTVNSLTTDSSPDIAADFLLSYDTSAGFPKKVLMNTITVPSTGCSVYQTTGTSITTATWTSVLFDTEEWDDDTWHSTSSNTDRITFNFTGRAVLVGTYDSNTTANATFGIRFKRNGTTVIANMVHATGSSGVNQVVGFAKEVSITSGDYITMEVYQASGGSVTSGTGIAGTSFSARRVK
jgi:hypothetical protein